MDDGAYASVFYGLTGLHGLHVLAGLLLLALVLGKLLGGSFDRDANPHVLFTAALWYWHFVDLVWIGLYLVVYLWGNAAGAEVLPETQECPSLGVEPAQQARPLKFLDHPPFRFSC